jgi:hypothetical protein
MINNQTANTNELTGLEIAKFILSKIAKYENGIKKKEEELVRNERLASEFIYFYIDTGWIRHNANGTYRITSKCINVIERMNWSIMIE